MEHPQRRSHQCVTFLHPSSAPAARWGLWEHSLLPCFSRQVPTTQPGFSFTQCEARNTPGHSTIAVTLPWDSQGALQQRRVMGRRPLRPSAAPGSPL